MIFKWDTDAFVLSHFANFNLRVSSEIFLFKLVKVGSVNAPVIHLYKTQLRGRNRCKNCICVNIGPIHRANEKWAQSKSNSCLWFNLRPSGGTTEKHASNLFTCVHLSMDTMFIKTLEQNAINCVRVVFRFLLVHRETTNDGSGEEKKWQTNAKRIFLSHKTFLFDFFFVSRRILPHLFAITQFALCVFVPTKVWLEDERIECRFICHRFLFRVFEHWNSNKHLLCFSLLMCGTLFSDNRICYTSPRCTESENFFIFCWK